MKTPEIPLKTLILLDLPAAVAQAVKAGLPAGWDMGHADTAIADVALAANADIAGPAGVPVLALQDSESRPVYDLSSLMARVEDMAAAPALYLSPFSPGGDATVNAAEKTLTLNGSVIALTDKEVDLLACLARGRGQAVSRNYLLSRVWGYAADIDTHTVETHIYRLRQKIGDEAATIIRTTAEGYALTLS